MPLKREQKSILNRYPAVGLLVELPSHVITDLKKIFDYDTIETDIEIYLIKCFDDY